MGIILPCRLEHFLPSTARIRWGNLISFCNGFDGRMVRVGHLSLQVIEESIACATKLPREGEWWHKHWFVPRASHNFVLNLEFRHVAGIKGYHHSWINPEYINPLTVIIHLVTCEGKFSIFKSRHLHLLAHFVDNRCLNFPFFSLRSLEKMSNLVRKNTLHPKSSLYHHSLIKL